MRISTMTIASALALAAAAIGIPASFASDPGGRLRPANDFLSIEDETARSRALFEEAGKVIQHPRCVNCHPAGDSPLQGMDMRIHEPPVSRGEGGMGVPGMTCRACHGDANVDLVAQSQTIRSMPGHPLWHLAPVEMAWEGRSLGEICAQIKDPARNGGKTMAEIVDHMAKDTLVGWGWNPGTGREPVPGTQDVFGQLIAAWVETGAACP